MVWAQKESIGTFLIQLGTLLKRMTSFKHKQVPVTITLNQKEVSLQTELPLLLN